MAVWGVLQRVRDGTRGAPAPRCAPRPTWSGPAPRRTPRGWTRSPALARAGQVRFDGRFGLAARRPLLGHLRHAQLAGARSLQQGHLLANALLARLAQWLAPLGTAVTGAHHERLRRLCLRGGSASFTSLRVMPAMGTHRSPPAPPQRHPSRARFGASNEEPCSSPKRRSSGPRLTAPREINTAWRTVVGLWELSCHGSSAAFVILPTSTQLPTRKLVSRRRTECAVRCFDTRWT